jgi:ribosomal protein S18 acetylase RimI-like enzyme
MDHKSVEEMSLNHWQPLSTLFYDGWILRFADGYTKRANSVSPIYYSTENIERKIEECEKMYTDNCLPTVFKMTPFVHPSDLDAILEDRGYILVDRTSIRTVKLGDFSEFKSAVCSIEETVSHRWIETYIRLNNVDPKHRDTILRMLSNIRSKTGFASLYHMGEVVACGFGVIERGYIGLYDVVTEVSHRNRGFGEQMIRSLLRWGRKNGAEYSYLAVVANNAPALRLYEKLGYSEIYRYWYRVKHYE